MSGSMLGMQGLGSGGMGMGGGQPQIPAGLLQMLMAHSQGQTPGAAMMGPQIGAQGAPPGAPQMMQQGQMPHGMTPPPQIPQGGPPQQMPGQMSSMVNGPQSPLSALLAQLKGQQQGVTPPGQPGAQQAPSFFGANGNAPAWLQAMLGGGAPAPAGVQGPAGMLGGGT